VLFNVTIVVYSDNHNKHIDKLCGQNAKFVSVKADGKPRYDFTLKGQIYFALTRQNASHANGGAFRAIIYCVSNLRACSQRSNFCLVSGMKGKILT
jgi:hypothetical protein